MHAFIIFHFSLKCNFIFVILRKILCNWYTEFKNVSLSYWDYDSAFFAIIKTVTIAEFIEIVFCNILLALNIYELIIKSWFNFFLYCQIKFNLSMDVYCHCSLQISGVYGHSSFIVTYFWKLRSLKKGLKVHFMFSTYIGKLDSPSSFFRRIQDLFLIWNNIFFSKKWMTYFDLFCIIQRLSIPAGQY